MCWVAAIPIASMAMTAASQVMQSREANANARRMAEARNNEALAEVERQKEYQAQADPVQQQVVQDLSADKQKQNLAQDQAARAAEASKAVSGSEYSPTVGTSSVVGSEIARQMSKAVKNARSTGAAQGSLAGYGDQGQQAGLNLDNAIRQLGTIGNFSRGSARLLPVRQSAAANNAYRAPSALPGLLGFAGTALGAASNFGGFGSGGGLVNADYPGDAFVGPLQQSQTPGMFQRWF